MNLTFQGKVALVTGAGRGMGRCHAMLLAQRGAKVVVSDVGAALAGGGADPSPAEKVVAKIRDFGGDAVPYFGDLTTTNGAHGAVTASLDAFGRIDILIHNASIALEGGTMADESVERLDNINAINARAAFNLVRAAWPGMVAQRGGRIVIVGSSAAFGIPRHIPYSTAKAAVIGLTRALAGEGEEYNIKINAIEPSAATRMAHERLADSDFRTWFLQQARPELVSPAVAFLAHEQCPLNGEILIVGGGRVARRIFAETHGYVNPHLTIEDVRDNLAKIFDETTLYYPDSHRSGQISAHILGFDQEGSTKYL